MEPTPDSVKNVLLWLPLIMLPASALPALTHFVPTVDLTGSFALSAYWITESGSRFGIPLIGAIMFAILISRSNVRWKQRIVEALVNFLGVAILLGGGALLNEHVVKPSFATPRPDILELAETPPNAPALKMSAEAFYALPDKALRSEHLRKILTPEVRLHERIRDHWIVETGYSFPSGHSFASMMLATFFMAMGLTYFSGRRLWVFYVLVLWAVAVCMSRPILRVHSPTDVCAGGLEGIVAGTLAFLFVRRILVVLQ